MVPRIFVDVKRLIQGSYFLLNPIFLFVPLWPYGHLKVQPFCQNAL